ncbi:MAG: hypothetical protein ACSLE6_18650 [Mycobacterium sp.]
MTGGTQQIPAPQANSRRARVEFDESGVGVIAEDAAHAGHVTGHTGVFLRLRFEQ